MIFYHGHNSKFGIETKSTFIWLSDSRDYAAMYGSKIAEFDIDEEKIKLASISNLEEICEKLDYDILDIIYNPCKEFITEIEALGFNAYVIPEKYLECLCLLDKTIVK